MGEAASLSDEIVVVSDGDSDGGESEVMKLRRRWELASVLNFLKVFKPVIGNDLKMTAQEIETSLINPNSSLAHLHIVLLKGTPPVAKMLNGPAKTLSVSGAWVTALCKKLAMWWPWVAEGDIPLTVAKGEEVSKYKKLDPTSRLLILKALCEIRADQNDIVSYISDSLKQGMEVSCFRKDKISDDGNGTSYWYDGDITTGYRLYKEVKKTRLKSKGKGKACSSPPDISLEWEMMATSLGEFRKVADEFSRSGIAAEVTVAKILESDPITSLEKIVEKKERALKRKQRVEELLNSRNSYNVGIPRSCRSRRPINYTFDDYDQAIDEAIQISKKNKTVKEQRTERKISEQNEDASNGDSDVHSGSNGNSTNTDDKGTDKPQDEAGNDSEDNDDDNYNGSGEDDNDNDNDNATDSENSGEEQENHKCAETISYKPKGSRWSERLNGGSNHSVMENGNLGTNNRLRQRPTQNSAIDSVVPDSDEENSSEQGDCSPVVVVADSEDERDN